MSADAREWAHKAGRRAGRSARQVLRELARCVDVDGGAVVTLGALAGEVGLSERSVRRAVRELEDLGLVRVQQMPGTVSVYTLAMDAAAPMPDLGLEVIEDPGGDAA